MFVVTEVLVVVGGREVVEFVPSEMPNLFREFGVECTDVLALTVPLQSSDFLHAISRSP